MQEKTLTNHHTQVCLDAWANCENLIKGIGQKSRKLSTHIAKTIAECAHICMGTFHAINANSVNTAKLALLCVGICDECADICEAIDDIVFQQCAQACRSCSNSISDLALKAI